MSIVDRLQTLARAELGAIGRRPPRDHVRRTLREASTALAELRTNERALDARRRELDAAIAEVQARAVRAVDARDDGAAHRALERKHELEHEARRLDVDLAEHRRRLQELRRALTELQDLAQARRTEPGRARLPGATPSGESLLDPEALDRLEEIETRIASMEAETQLSTTLDPLADPDAERIDREFRGLEVRQALDDTRRATDALDRLRRRMNPDDQT